MGQDGVHPGHAEDGEGDVEAAHHQHVPVVGRPLVQPKVKYFSHLTDLPDLDELVVRAVDHGLRDVLVHEEEQRQRKPEHHSRQNDLEVEVCRDRKMEDLLGLEWIVSSLY